MTPRPLWLFDSPLLRQALAQVNLPAVPAIGPGTIELTRTPSGPHSIASTLVMPMTPALLVQ